MPGLLRAHSDSSVENRDQLMTGLATERGRCDVGKPPAWKLKTTGHNLPRNERTCQLARKARMARRVDVRRGCGPPHGFCSASRCRLPTLPAPRRPPASWSGLELVVTRHAQLTVEQGRALLAHARSDGVSQAAPEGCKPANSGHIILREIDRYRPSGSDCRRSNESASSGATLCHRRRVGGQGAHTIGSGGTAAR